MPFVLYSIEGAGFKISACPQGVTGEQFVKGIPGATFFSNHETFRQAELEKEKEEHPEGAP